MKKIHQLTCSRCSEPVQEQDTFCKNCGGVFSNDLRCKKHTSMKAVGVCVICSTPCCKKCGGDVQKTFLCNNHADLEITEGKVRVFGSTDNVRAQFAVARLKQAGYHPFYYSRLFNPVADKVAITGVRNFGNHPIEEQKVYIPFPEFTDASRELKKHKFKEI